MYNRALEEIKKLNELDDIEIIREFGYRIEILCIKDGIEFKANALVNSKMDLMSFWIKNEERIIL